MGTGIFCGFDEKGTISLFLNISIYYCCILNLINKEPDYRQTIPGGFNLGSHQEYVNWIVSFAFRIF
jgi:hypothetical protein